MIFWRDRMFGNGSNKYDDIINLPYRKSTKRKHMEISMRAAQFAPFSALTGYDELVEETARITDSRVVIDEYVKADINEKLIYISENLDEKIKVSITYFVPDEKKQGGKYITVSGFVKKIKEYEKKVIMWDEREIPIEEIISIKEL